MTEIAHDGAKGTRATGTHIRNYSSESLIMDDIPGYTLMESNIAAGRTELCNPHQTQDSTYTSLSSLLCQETSAQKKARALSKQDVVAEKNGNKAAESSLAIIRKETGNVRQDTHLPKVNGQKNYTVTERTCRFFVLPPNSHLMWTSSSGWINSGLG